MFKLRTAIFLVGIFVTTLGLSQVGEFPQSTRAEIEQLKDEKRTDTLLNRLGELQLVDLENDKYLDFLLAIENGQQPGNNIEDPGNDSQQVPKMSPFAIALLESFFHTAKDSQRVGFTSEYRISDQLIMDFLEKIPLSQRDHCALPDHLIDRLEPLEDLVISLFEERGGSEDEFLAAAPTNCDAGRLDYYLDAMLGLMKE